MVILGNLHKFTVHFDHDTRNLEISEVNLIT